MSRPGAEVVAPASLPGPQAQPNQAGLDDQGDQGDNPAPITLHGVRIGRGPHLHASVAQSMAGGHYEADELRALAALLQPDDVVLELGTGIGFLSAYCALQIGSDRVHTFEANPALEPVIRRTFALNGVAPRLEICVLGGGPGEIDFFVDEAFWSSSLLPGATSAKGANSIKVPVKGFAEEMARLRPSLMICDIEGGEVELLRDADLAGLRALVIELHPAAFGLPALQVLVNRLYALGFVALPNASSGDVLGLQRGAEAATGALNAAEAIEHLAWSRWQRALRATLQTVPADATLIVVDDDCWPSNALGSRRRLHLMDADGQSAGLPADDADAIAEVERLRAAGAGYLVIACTAQWWRTQYHGLLDHLRRDHRCLHEGADLLVFALRRPAGASAGASGGACAGAAEAPR